MRLVELFVVRGKNAISVFTAPQSLVAYPLSVCIVATLTRAARTILRSDVADATPPFLAALVVGGAIVAIVASDRLTRPRHRRDWVGMIVVGIVNSLVLFVAALGIEKF
jgi:hypothetical protein